MDRLNDGTRRFWLIAWLGSWGLMVVIGALSNLGVLDDVGLAFKNEFTTAVLGVVLLSLFVAPPLCFIVASLPQRDSSRRSSLGPTQSVAEARRALADLLGKDRAWSDAAEHAATEFACAVLAAGTDEQRVIAELRDAGLSRLGAGQILLATYERGATADADDGDHADESVPGAQPTEPSADDALICPHCAKPIDRFDHFCPSCANPVTAHASIDPLGQVYAAGRAYNRAASGRTKLIIVSGMWLIFGPQIPLLLFGGYMILSDLIAPGNVYPPGKFVTVGDGGTMTLASHSQLYHVLGLLLALAFLALYSAILWQVTRHYQESHRAVQRRRLGLCEQCGYDLRGTIDADRDSCPECGAVRAGEAGGAGSTLDI